MAEIGETLREARMRLRVDISDVETATKIRAKYLRGLENEEWGLLPGPAFVKSFMRTYCDYLEIESKDLIDEYKHRYERPSPSEQQGFSSKLGSGRTRTKAPPRISPLTVIVLGLIVLAVILYLFGKFKGT